MGGHSYGIHAFLNLKVQKEMFRKSSLLCLTSNENYSFNLDLVACSANRREEDLFTGNQVSDMAAMPDEIHWNTSEFF